MSARVSKQQRHRRNNRTACEPVHYPKGEDVMQLVNAVKSFVRNDEGQDLLEYALLVALIAIVAVGAVTAAGTQVSNIFNQIATAI